MVRLTESGKGYIAELAWTVFGATVLMALLWEVLHIGGPYVTP